MFDSRVYPPKNAKDSVPILNNSEIYIFLLIGASLS